MDRQHLTCQPNHSANIESVRCRLGSMIVTFISLQHLIQRLPALVSAFLFLAVAIGFDLLLSL